VPKERHKWNGVVIPLGPSFIERRIKIGWNEEGSERK
jgi:hypothetical protein